MLQGTIEQTNDAAAGVELSPFHQDLLEAYEARGIFDEPKILDGVRDDIARQGVIDQVAAPMDHTIIADE